MYAHAALAQRKERWVTLMRQRLLQIGALIADTEHLVSALDREIAAEEQRTRLSDPTHVAYSTYATTARARRHNLQQSISALCKERDNLAADLDAFRDGIAAAQGRDRDTSTQDALTRDWKLVRDNPAQDLQGLMSAS